MPTRITSPADPALAELCDRLRAMAIELDTQPHWPVEQLRLCGEYGVYEWFLPPEWGGQGWSDDDVVRGYHALSAACLTTAFILTQRIGACRRIAGAQNAELKQRWLPPLVRGDIFATVGISHLTTSRRHVTKPVLSAERTTERISPERQRPVGHRQRRGGSDRHRRHRDRQRRSDRGPTSRRAPHESPRRERPPAVAARRLSLQQHRPARTA